MTECLLGYLLAAHTWEIPYLCILRRGMQPARDILIFRTGLYRLPQSKLPNSYDISDLLGILTSRREWPEARISVGIPVRVLVRTRLRSAAAFRTEPNRSGLNF